MSETPSETDSVRGYRLPAVPHVEIMRMHTNDRAEGHFGRGAPEPESDQEEDDDQELNVSSSSAESEASSDDSEHRLTREDEWALIRDTYLTMEGSLERARGAMLDFAEEILSINSGEVPVSDEMVTACNDTIRQWDSTGPTAFDWLYQRTVRGGALDAQLDFRSAMRAQESLRLFMTPAIELGTLLHEIQDCRHVRHPETLRAFIVRQRSRPAFHWSSSSCSEDESEDEDRSEDGMDLF